MKARYISARGQWMTAEAERILVAAAIGRDRVRTNNAARWIVTGEPWRPDRRTREALVKGGYLAVYTGPDFRALRLTDKGREALFCWGAA